MSDRDLSPSQRSRSASRGKSADYDDGSRGDSRSRSRSESHSRHRSHRRRSRSRSRSRSRRRYSRSRSYSRRRYSRSRSRSYDKRRSSRYYDDHRDRDDGYRGRSRSRSPLSSRRRHQGDRENPQKSRCVGVFGLSLYTQERDLRERFERYGPIEEVQVVYDHQTGRSRGFAFVYYENHQDAAEAKELAPGMEIDGRKIRVDFSITQRAHTPTPGVYLGKPTSGTSYRSRLSRSPVGGGRRYDSRRRSRSYSHSYSRSPRR